MSAIPNTNNAVMVEPFNIDRLEQFIGDTVEKALSKNSLPANCLIVPYDQLPENIPMPIYKLLTGYSATTYWAHVHKGILKLSEGKGGKKARLVLKRANFIKYLESEKKKGGRK